MGPGSPVVKDPTLTAKGHGSISGQGTEILQAEQHSK